MDQTAKAISGVGWGRGGRGENGVKASRLNMTSAGWGSELIQAAHCPGIWSPCLTQLTFGARLEDVAGGWRVTLVNRNLPLDLFNCPSV